MKSPARFIWAANASGWRKRAESRRIASSKTGAPVKAKLVIGADGVHSVVRAALFGAAEAAILRHHRVARRRADGAPSGVVSRAASAPIGSVPAATSCIIRCAAGTLLNFVGMRERADWTVEGWNVRGTTEELLNDFRGWHADVHAHHPQHRRAVQMGAGAAPDHGGLEQGPLHAARRRLPSDGAVSCARRRHGARGRLGAGALPGKISGRSCHGVCALRGGAPRRAPTRSSTGSADMIPALPQPGDGRRRCRASPCRAGMASRIASRSATTGCSPTTRSRSRCNRARRPLSACGCGISSAALSSVLSSSVSPVSLHAGSECRCRRADRYIPRSARRPAHAGQRLARPQDREGAFEAAQVEGFFRHGRVANAVTRPYHKGDGPAGISGFLSCRCASSALPAGVAPARRR